MNASLFLEVLCAVTLQSTVLLALTAWLERRVATTRRDRLWFVAHVLTLAITVSAFLLPHPRWASLAGLLPTQDLSAYQRTWANAATFVAAIYLSGAGLRVALLIVGGLRAVRNERLTTVSTELTELARTLFPQGEFARREGIVRLAHHRAPTRCWRWQRPVIVLSRRVLALSPAERDMVLRHELAHLEANHPLHLFVQSCVESLLWFHPLVHRSSRRAELARELLCDAAAIEPLGDSHAYFGVLLTLAEEEFDAAPRAALAFARRGSLLHARLAAATTHGTRACGATFATPALTVAAIFVAALLWPPLNPAASSRERWSPWPAWSSTALQSLGVNARDYEVDAHRLTHHHR